MIFISRMKTTCHKTATISSPPGQFIFSPQCSSSTYCCASPSNLRSRKLNSQARTIFPKQIPNWFQISKQKCRRNLPFVFFKNSELEGHSTVFFPAVLVDFSYFCHFPLHPTHFSSAGNEQVCIYLLYELLAPSSIPAQTSAGWSKMQPDFFVFFGGEQILWFNFEVILELFPYKLNFRNRTDSCGCLLPRAFLGGVFKYFHEKNFGISVIVAFYPQLANYKLRFVNNWLRFDKNVCRCLQITSPPDHPVILPQSISLFSMFLAILLIYIVNMMVHWIETIFCCFYEEKKPPKMTKQLHNRKVSLGPHQ